MEQCFSLLQALFKPGAAAYTENFYGLRQVQDQVIVMAYCLQLLTQIQSQVH